MAIDSADVIAVRQKNRAFNALYWKVYGELEVENPEVASTELHAQVIEQMRVRYPESYKRTV